MGARPACLWLWRCSAGLATAPMLGAYRSRLAAKRMAARVRALLRPLCCCALPSFAPLPSSSRRPASRSLVRPPPGGLPPAFPRAGDRARSSRWGGAAVACRSRRCSSRARAARFARSLPSRLRVKGGPWCARQITLPLASARPRCSLVGVRPCGICTVSGLRGGLVRSGGSCVVLAPRAFDDDGCLGHLSTCISTLAYHTSIPARNAISIAPRTTLGNVNIL